MKYKGGERGGDGDHPEQACPQPQKVGHQLQHHLGPAGEAAVWVQHDQQILPALSLGDSGSLALLLNEAIFAGNCH